MKSKFILPLLTSTVVIVTMPFFTSCGKGESETDMMMDQYARNVDGTSIIKTQDEYFSEWQALPNKLDCVEYSLFSFILEKNFEVLEGTSIKLLNTDSLFSLSNGEHPILLPFFYTNNLKSKIITDDQDINKYVITYVGQMAFEFQYTYTFENDAYTCVKGDLLKFTLEFSGALFYKALIAQPLQPHGIWLEEYDTSGIIGNAFGIAEIQSHGGPFVLSSISKKPNWIPYSNYFNYGY